MGPKPHITLSSSGIFQKAAAGKNEEDYSKGSTHEMYNPKDNMQNFKLWAQEAGITKVQGERI